VQGTLHPEASIAVDYSLLVLEIYFKLLDELSFVSWETSIANHIAFSEASGDT
jgi:hypothetical protein